MDTLSTIAMKRFILYIILSNLYIRMKKSVTVVRIRVRKTLRNPIVLYKAAAKTTMFSFFPTEINDVALKHVEMTLNQVIHGVQDTIILSAIESCLKAVLDASNVSI